MISNLILDVESSLSILDCQGPLFETVESIDYEILMNILYINSMFLLNI